MTSKKFKRLEKEIEHEYEHEGFGHERAEYIGRATAGKIAREKMQKKDPPHRHNEPFANWHLSEDPTNFLNNYNKKITGKVEGGYGLDFKL